jgi:hypothetical protein
VIESAIEDLIDVGWHRVDFSVQFFLNFDDILLISLGDEVDSQSDLSESTGSADSV